jgi:hypothetical protein
MARTIAAATPAPRPRAYAKPQPAPQKPAFTQKLQLPALLLIGAVGGFFADSLMLGLALLTAYAIAAVILRIPSRLTFTLTLLLLAAISVLLLLKPNMHLIGNFSTYSFVLLVIGVITLGREARPPKRMRRKYRR